MPKNGASQYIALKITNTTNEDAMIRVYSSNTDIVVTSDSNPLELTPVPNAKGHAQISITISAGGKSDTKTFTVYVGEKPKKIVPIMMDDMTIMVPLD